MEAESDALTEIICKTQWLRNLYSELNKPIKSLTLVLKNNQSTIKAVKDLALHSRIKHTLLKYRYIKEVRQVGIFNILYIDTKRIPVNGLIKPLSGIAHQKFLNLIGLNLIWTKLITKFRLPSPTNMTIRRIKGYKNGKL